jgi:hypothetical protein
MATSSWLFGVSGALLIAVGAGGLVLVRPGGGRAAADPVAARHVRLLVCGALTSGAAGLLLVVLPFVPPEWDIPLSVVLAAAWAAACAMVVIGTVRLVRRASETGVRFGARR